MKLYFGFADTLTSLLLVGKFPFAFCQLLLQGSDLDLRLVKFLLERLVEPLPGRVIVFEVDGQILGNAGL
jgi:hypothetical protein